LQKNNFTKLAIQPLKPYLVKKLGPLKSNKELLILLWHIISTPERNTFDSIYAVSIASTVAGNKSLSKSAAMCVAHAKNLLPATVNHYKYHEQRRN
jgi:hypothetical protein